MCDEKFRFFVHDQKFVVNGEESGGDQTIDSGVLYEKFRWYTDECGTYHT